ncbi:hypothetical protein ACX3YC_13635 [Pseudomonas mohnii]
MEDRPTNQEFSEVLGITENEVGTYVVQYTPLAEPGGWMLTFSVETPGPLRKKALLNKKLVRAVSVPPRG